MNISNIFNQMLKEKSKFTQARKGSEFEDRFEDVCKNNGFTRKLSSDLTFELKKIKKNIFDDCRTEPLENIFSNQPTLIDFFVSQPFGSQNYPDFLIFTKKYIVPIEIKYSSDKSKKPVWNGNIPKANGIYIFGNGSIGEFTFFLGNDVLPNKERKILISFWDRASKNHIEHHRDMKQMLDDSEIIVEYGFDVYPRKTYQQNQQINKFAILDFFKNPNKSKLEASVLKYLGEIDE